MELTRIDKVFLLGIGGIGMSALARYFNSIGKEVCGYDKTPSPLTDKLLEEGCEIFFNEEPERIPVDFLKENTLFIYTPAIKNDNPLYGFVLNNELLWHKRAEVLGMISKNCFTIAVAGTHGKTTTTSLVAHLLRELNINFTAFLGGIASNFGTNYIRYEDGKNSIEGTEVVVLEADEYDKSFLHLNPNISILTSTDADHLDIYKNASNLNDTFQEFLNNTITGGLQIVHESLDVKETIDTITYGDIGLANYELTNRTPFSFNYNYNDLVLRDLECGLPGIHNLENTVAAITAILPLVINPVEIKNALLNFKGVKRRFEVVYKSNTSIVIDDYAHHPTEIEKFVTSVKMMFPKERIVGIFQPHLFSRTQDFYAEFGESLSLLDECYMLPIYPAREAPIPGITSEIILKKISIDRKEVLSKDSIIKKIETSTPNVLLIMGAGDIDRLVQPIVNIYNNKNA